ncbi:MAG: type I polyketide synthase, partial [Anaerolineales bacterium]|nr:type I polyketide synthase [Anaerolineales bacterium]
VIRGSAINQDGRSNGLTAPNGPSQEAVIRAALANGGVDAAQVSYIETHGTGTSLGDPIEVQALGAVFDQVRADKPLLLGAVKTNIGHLESAAGIAGLVKVVLALQYGAVPANLHLQQRSPVIPWEDFPTLTLPTRLSTWEAADGRFAGVSSFGFSGTNAHIVLGEAPLAQEAAAQVGERPLHVLALSARNETALRELAEAYANVLKRGDESGQKAAGGERKALADVAYTANAGRSHFSHRLALTAANAADAEAQLAAFVAGKKTENMQSGVFVGTRRPKIAFLFTGQGAQYVGMGRQLYETQPVFRAALEKCQEVLRPYLQHPLLDVMFGERLAASDPSLINETAYTQPALFAIEYALAELWQSWGVRPDAVTGHSVGEYVAAVVAGVLSLEDGLQLIATRGRLMQALPGGGAMAAVFADEATVMAALAPYAQQASLAAVNGATNVVISGAGTAVAAILDTLQAQNIKSRSLVVSHAFHSPLLEPMLDEFEQVAATLTYHPPRMSLISNVTGKALGRQDVNAAYWRRHARQPVRFADAVATLRAQGCRILLEAGPQPTLLGMVARIASDVEGETAVPSLRQGKDEWAQMLNGLGALYTAGVAVDWASFDKPYARRKVTLPTYPFQRSRYWVDVPTQKRGSAAIQRERLHPLLGWRVAAAGIRELIFENEISVAAFPFLQDHQLHGLYVLPSPAYMEMALAAVKQLAWGGGNPRLDDLVIHEALVLAADETRQVQLVLTPGDGQTAAWQIYSEDNGRWQLHASGRLQTQTAVPVLAEAETLSAV